MYKLTGDDHSLRTQALEYIDVNFFCWLILSQRMILLDFYSLAD